MAISPIDLQTLFTQVDKVGKQEAASREGAALLHSVQQARIQQQLDERIRSVNEAQNMGEGAESIQDKNGGKPEHGGAGRRREEEKKTAEREEEEVIKDPALGKNIDVSL
ncbi:MAG: SS18 family protein [Spirochaetaceae bacterium]|jgi:low affinity Fe/Cu permease|nr:SS18 family protein [Spirochaetaceae bacterium]